VSAAIFISPFSVVIALAALVVNLTLTRRAAVLARKPVLVFVDDFDQGCWVLRNVGNGPALNVLVAQRAGGEWFNPVLVPPIGNDGSFPLQWLGHVEDTGLGAVYGDFEGRRYTTTVGGEFTLCYEGDRLPRWTTEEVAGYWAVPYGAGGREHAKASTFAALDHPPGGGDS
jgi:hypothetical protein